MFVELKSVNSFFDTEKDVVISRQNNLITVTPLNTVMLFEEWVDMLSDDDIITINENRKSC